MATIQEGLTQISALDGFVSAALVDCSSGMMLGQINSNGMDLDVAAAANSEVVKSQRKVMAQLGMTDNIEDMLITLGSQYHILRPSSKEGADAFFYVVLDRDKANLALSRVKVLQVEKTVEI